MPTVVRQPDTEHASALTTLGRWATDARAVLAALGIVLYAVLRIAYSIFYDAFGLTPDQLGFGFLDLLVQSAVGVVILLAATLLIAAVLVVAYVGFLQLERRPVPGKRIDSRAARASSPLLLGARAICLVAAFGLVAAAMVGGPGVLWLVGFALAGAVALPEGLGRINRGLSGAQGEDPAWWRRGLVAVACATMALAIGALLVKASADAQRVRHGHAAGFAVAGFRVTTWGAEAVTLNWTGKPPAALPRLAGRCLLYFGQANGTAFFYLASSREVLRIPASIVVVQSGPFSCKPG